MRQQLAGILGTDFVAGRALMVVVAVHNTWEGSAWNAHGIQWQDFAGHGALGLGVQRDEVPAGDNSLWLQLLP